MWIPAALIPARLEADAWSRHLIARLAFSLAAGGILGGAPGLVSVVAGWADAHCLLLALTGWPCPGCGVTTSLMAVGAGDVQRAVRANPAGVAVAAALVAQAMLAVLVTGTGGGEGRGRAWLEWQDRLVVAALALGWIARLSGGR